MQCQEDTGFCSGRKNLQCLSSTVYSSDFSKHLLFLCSFNNLGCLISFNEELHEFLMYTWIWSPYQICDLQIYFFHSIGCHFILLMAFSLLCRRFRVWCGLTSLFLQFLPLLWWLSCLSCLYFGKKSFISCFICYYLLPCLPKHTDWLNG